MPCILLKQVSFYLIELLCFRQSWKHSVEVCAIRDGNRDRELRSFYCHEKTANTLTLRVQKVEYCQESVHAFDRSRDRNIRL